MNNLEQKPKATLRAPYIPALILFAASRVVMLVAMAFANRMLPTEPAASTWDATSKWFRFLLRYDSGWYLHIATHGYSYNGNNLIEQPIVFYPLYPALIKALTWLGVSEAAAAVLIPNAAIVAAIIPFSRLVRELYDPQTAVLSVAFLSFFPTSLFFSAGYTESLAFLLIVYFFVFLGKGRFLLAAGFAGLCFATRSTGMALIAPLMWEIGRSYWRKDRRRFFVEGAACLVIATSGLWLFMVYLWAKFRAPFAFIGGTTAWNVDRSFGNPLLLRPFVRTLIDTSYSGLTPNALAPWLFVLFVALLIIFRKKLKPPMVLFGAGVLLLPYFTLSSSVGFVSFSRYILLAFPVFIVAASLCRRRVWLALAICGISGALLFWYTALFAKWYWVG